MCDWCRLPYSQFFGTQFHKAGCKINDWEKREKGKDFMLIYTNEMKYNRLEVKA